MDSAIEQDAAAKTLLESIFPEQTNLLAALQRPLPCGRDLDGTLELNAFEMACAEPEEAILKGVVNSDNRNWREIRQKACRLLEESLDLRLAVQLCRALMKADGLIGFCAGLCLTGSLAERHWDELYPALEPEDRDPTRRVNAFAELVSEPVLNDLRLTPVFVSSQFKRVTANDLLLTGSSSLGKAHLESAASHEVFAAIDALGADVLKAHLQLIEAASTQLRRLSAHVREHARVALPLDVLASGDASQPGLLDAMSEILAEEWARLTPAAASDPARPEVRAAGQGGSGEIARREDVVQLLDRICAYYARVEPSSPVPLLLQRAKRIAVMDFVSIMRDLADQGLPQLGLVAGISIEGADASEEDD